MFLPEVIAQAHFILFRAQSECVLALARRRGSLVPSLALTSHCTGNWNETTNRPAAGRPVQHGNGRY